MQAGETGNDEHSGHHHGGVGGHGTRGSVEGVKDEISTGGPDGSTANTTPHTEKVRAASGEVGTVHSSDEGGNDAGAKGPYLVDEDSAGQDAAMALFGEITTPPKVRKLQRTLYRKAKEDKRWRAWSLYADLCRRDVPETALKSVLRNAGAPGVDGVTVEAVKGRIKRDRSKKGRIKRDRNKSKKIAEADGRVSRDGGAIDGRGRLCCRSECTAA